jgi:hypothetical protein
MKKLQFLNPIPPASAAWSEWYYTTHENHAREFGIHPKE